MATIFNIKRFGTMEGAIRCTTQIQRLFANAIYIGQDHPTRELTSKDLDVARHYWYRQLQRETFAAEMEALKLRELVSRSSHIAIFRPYLNEDGLIRLHARIRLSSDPGATPDVPILPCKLPGEKGLVCRRIRSSGFGYRRADFRSGASSQEKEDQGWSKRTAH